jgi:hypothetical protein
MGNLGDDGTVIHEPEFDRVDWRFKDKYSIEVWKDGESELFTIESGFFSENIEIIESYGFAPQPENNVIPEVNPVY